MDTDRKLTRRASLLGFAGLAAGALGGRLAPDEADAAGPAAVASGSISCILTPELTEGPYYIAGEPFRRDVTEGRPGTTLMLKTTVVDAGTCKPIKRATVEIWHADAAGDYSGFGNGASSRTFMRGQQRTDRNGLAVFKTVYPGWYSGRTVHVHVKVHVGGNVVHTGQLFFPEAVSAKVYSTGAYASRGTADTSNAADAIFRNGGPKGLLKLTRRAYGYDGTITMGVTR
jgi:protocatechuate 3,4-dioxygenase beta subunit